MVVVVVLEEESLDSSADPREVAQLNEVRINGKNRPTQIVVNGVHITAPDPKLSSFSAALECYP